METQLSIISLITATVVLGIIFGAGVRERILNIPRWFSNPPVSFEIIRQQAKFAPRFWIPVQIVFVIALATALTTNWNETDVRLYLLLGTACFVLVIALTAIYFVKEIMAFQKIPVTAPATPELLQRVSRWYRTTIIRNIFQGIALGLFIAACFSSR